MPTDQLTEQIIGAAFTVHNALGPGYLESVDENALRVELELAGLKVETQVPLVVRYRERTVGEFVADLIVEGTVLVELKATRALATSHEVQLVNYLTGTGMDVGLLLNFGASKVEVRRKVRVFPG